VERRRDWTRSCRRRWRAKASLVALYFMHLRYDRPFLAIVFVTSLVFVMLFVGLALMDTVEYQPELIPGFAPALDRV